MKNWDPFGDLLTIQDRMNKLFESVLSGPVAPEMEGPSTSYWRPPSDVVETPDGVEISCELAGMCLEEVTIDARGNWLVLRGERRRAAESERWAFHQLERPFGAFVRRFELPAGLDLERAEASMRDGVLSVRVPRSVACRTDSGQKPGSGNRSSTGAGTLTSTSR